MPTPFEQFLQIGARGALLDQIGQNQARGASIAAHNPRTARSRVGTPSFGLGGVYGSVFGARPTADFPGLQPPTTPVYQPGAPDIITPTTMRQKYGRHGGPMARERYGKALAGELTDLRERALEQLMREQAGMGVGTLEDAAKRMATRQAEERELAARLAQEERQAAEWNRQFAARGEREDLASMEQAVADYNREQAERQEQAARDEESRRRYEESRALEVEREYRQQRAAYDQRADREMSALDKIEADAEKRRKEQEGEAAARDKEERSAKRAEARDLRSRYERAYNKELGLAARTAASWRRGRVDPLQSLNLAAMAPEFKKPIEAAVARMERYRLKLLELGIELAPITAEQIIVAAEQLGDMGGDIPYEQAPAGGRGDF